MINSENSKNSVNLKKTNKVAKLSQVKQDAVILDTWIRLVFQLEGKYFFPKKKLRKIGFFGLWTSRRFNLAIEYLHAKFKIFILPSLNDHGVTIQLITQNSPLYFEEF